MSSFVTPRKRPRSNSSPLSAGTGWTKVLRGLDSTMGGLTALLSPAIEGLGMSTPSPPSRVRSVSLPTIQRAKSQKMKRSNTRNAYLGGKVYAKSKVSRKQTRTIKRGKNRGKKQLTRLGLQNKGVRQCQEIRFVSKTDQVAADRYEAIQIGHTSMPTKTVMMNVMRALVKHCLSSVCDIKDFTDNVSDNAKGYKFNANDVMKIYYYPDWQADTVANLSYTIFANQTFEEIAIGFFDQFKLLYSTGESQTIRYSHFTYTPSFPPANSIYQFFSKELRSLSVECEVKSSLKVQNRTVNVTGNDEADDVDNVPLQGYLYKCKGNNIFNKSNRRVLKGVGLDSFYRSNDIILFDGIARTAPTTFVNSGEFVQVNPSNSVFNKPSEPAKPYELYNCVKSGKLRVNPGAIQTSVLNQHYKFSFHYMITLLCTGALIGNALRYEKNKGYTQVMHLEKVIGSVNSSVAIAAEVNFDIWTAVTSRGDNKFTSPVILQADYGTYP